MNGKRTPFYNTTYDFFRILAPRKSVMDIRGVTAAHIAQRVKDAVGVTPVMEIVAREEIYRPGDTLKSRRVVDLRKG